MRLTELPTITPGSDQWADWRQYFERHLEFTPWFMLEVLKGRRDRMSVPTEWPVMFDPNYKTDPDWYPAAVNRDPDPDTIARQRASRESYEELRERYGSSWGISEAAVDTRIPRRSNAAAGRELYDLVVASTRNIDQDLT